jgi:hypothetical protein
LGAGPHPCVLANRPAPNHRPGRGPTEASAVPRAFHVRWRPHIGNRTNKLGALVEAPTPCVPAPRNVLHQGRVVLKSILRIRLTSVPDRARQGQSWPRNGFPRRNDDLSGPNGLVSGANGVISARRHSSPGRTESSPTPSQPSHGPGGSSQAPTEQSPAPAESSPAATEPSPRPGQLSPVIRSHPRPQRNDLRLVRCRPRPLRSHLLPARSSFPLQLNHLRVLRNHLRPELAQHP